MIFLDDDCAWHAANKFDLATRSAASGCCTVACEVVHLTHVAMACSPNWLIDDVSALVTLDWAWWLDGGTEGALNPGSVQM